MRRYTVCKLENQESQWYNSIQILRPENKGSHGVSLTRWRPKNVGRGTGVRLGSNLKTQEKGTPMSSAREDECPSSRTKKENLPFLHLLVPFKLPMSWMMLAHIGEGSLLFFHPFTFNRQMSLDLKQVSCKQYIAGSHFLIHFY